VDHDARRHTPALETDSIWSLIAKVTAASYSDGIWKRWVSWMPGQTRRVGMATRRVRMTVKRTVTVRRTVQVRRTTQVRQTTNARAHLSQEQRGDITATSRALALPATRAGHLADAGYGPIDDSEREFDLFLSYATENKEFVRPLADALIARGVRVWFDETEIGVGDSLRESIDKGLVRSRFGVVIFSHAFFSKRWTAYELNGLVTREMSGRKVVLPVWHPELTAEDVIAYSPSLADKKALVASRSSMEEIADALTDLVLASNTD
jgi:hypothetical protein